MGRTDCGDDAHEEFEHMAPTKNKRMIWAWLPALLVLVGSIVTAAGISLMPSASAASGSVDITGTVTGDISFSNVCNDTTNPFNGTALNIGSFAPNDPAAVVGNGAGAAGCEVTFASNDDAELLVADSTPATAFFCKAATTCLGADNFANENGNGTMEADEFAIGLESTSGTNACNSGCATGSGAGYAPLVAAGSPGLADDTGWKPVTGKICGATASTSGVTCDLAFAARPGGTGNQNQGSYAGTANFTANTIP